MHLSFGLHVIVSEHPKNVFSLEALDGKLDLHVECGQIRQHQKTQNEPTRVIIPSRVISRWQLQDYVNSFTPRQPDHSSVKQHPNQGTQVNSGHHLQQ